MLRFSIISLHWNSRSVLSDLLDRHVKSLLETQYEEFEVIFVDNGSTDGTAEYVKARYLHPRLRILELKSNYGFAKGNNIGSKYVDPRSDIVVFINSDTVVERNWLEELAKAFSDPEVGVAQPLILDLDTEERTIQFMGGFMDRFGRNMVIGSSNNREKGRVLYKLMRYFGYRPLQVLWPLGACIAIRRDILNRIGGFNELFKFGLEELTISVPAVRLGFKVVVVPRSVIYHKYSATLKLLNRSAEQIRNYMRNRFLFILLYYEFPLVVGGLIGRSIIEFWLSLRNRHLQHYLKVWIWVLANLRMILHQRRRTLKLSSNSPYIIRTPLILTRRAYDYLALAKLLEINKRQENKVRV